MGIRHIAVFDIYAFKLVLIINTENAVELLKLLHGGNMFEVVRAPKVTKDAVLRCRGVEFAQTFEDCDNCIGNAEDSLMKSHQCPQKSFTICESNNMSKIIVCYKQSHVKRITN